jgi:streptogramin lyase
VAGGVLWVADGGNNRVLRFDAVTGLGDGPSASRVVGQPNGTTNTATTTQTGLSLPNSLCIDGSGALWIADRGNNRVLRFDAAASIAVDGAAATAVLGQTLFTTATSALTQSGLNSPRGVNVSTTGRLWVADTANNRVLWFDSAAVKINGGIADGVLGQASFTTSASGVTSQKLDGPEGAFQDTSGHLWVADSNNNRALRFSSPASGSIPPVIRLTNAGRHIFPAASQHIKGTSSDADGRVVAVKGSVNGRPFTLAKGTTSWNFHAKKLRKGRNLIRIFALDDDGLQSNVLQVTIIRKNPRH